MHSPFHLSTAGAADSRDGCETEVGSTIGSVGSVTKGVLTLGLGHILATTTKSTEAVWI